jgi:hypothetical protein
LHLGRSVDKLTKKSQAQLWRFGGAVDSVQRLKERIHLFMLVKCGFADILPCDTYVDPPPYAKEKQSKGNNVTKNQARRNKRPEYANLLDKWLVTEWVTLHKRSAGGQPQPKLEEDYCRHVSNFD